MIGNLYKKLNEFQIDDDYSLQTWNTTKDRSPKIVTCKNNEIIPPFPVQNKSLFKFYSFTDYNIDAFVNNYFWMSKPGTFNDPLDFNINLIRLKEGEKLDKKIRDELSNSGITCFTKNLKSPLMWGHYTNGLNGYAIEFNSDIGNLQIPKKQKFYIRQAIYPTLIPLLNINYPVNSTNDFNISAAQFYISIVKQHAWNYEEEVRLVSYSLDDKNRRFGYDPSIIKSILIGHKALASQAPHARLLVSKILNSYQDKKIQIVFPHPEKTELKFGTLTEEDLKNYINGNRFDMESIYQ